MALNTLKMWSKGIKTDFFPKNFQKSRNGCGLSPQTLISSGGREFRYHIPICDPFELHYFLRLPI